MHWCESKVVTGRDSVEAVSAKLMDLGAAGVAVEDFMDWETAKKEGLGDIFPDTAAADYDRVTIRGYFPLSFLFDGKVDTLSLFLAELPAFGLAPATLFTRRVDEADWEAAWKQYWRPTPVGSRLLVLPAWLEAPAVPQRIILRLDPGAAFGTGTHESTRLCLELLEQSILGGETVLDLGCGSGILALSARLLGAETVSGVDLDEAAVRASKANAERNQLSDVLFFQADLHAADVWHRLGQADVVTANLTADVLLTVKDQVCHTLRPGGLLIASGIVRGREADVVEGFCGEGYRVTERKSAGEWIALLLELTA